VPRRDHRPYFKYADGCIVGSSLKVGGYTWNPVDQERAKRFVDRPLRVGVTGTGPQTT